MTRAKKSRKVNTNGPARPARMKRDENHKTGKKIGKGHATGSRHSGAAVKRNPQAEAKAVDPRHGSKKPIALTVDAPKAETKPQLSPEKELAQLEQSPRLAKLLDQVEGGELLAQADQFWLDTTLARIAVLMDTLGISDDDIDDEPEQPQAAASEDADLFDQFEQGNDLLDQFKD